MFRKYGLLACILVVVLILAACGGAQEPAPTATAEPEPTEAPAEEPTEAPTEEPAAEPEPTEATDATEEPAASDGVITVGVLNPTTGGLAVFGEQVNTGIELYFNSVDNTVAGRQVELSFADTAGDPQQALEQARRLVNQEGVDLLMGTVNSAVVVPLAQFADEQQVPLLLTVGGAQVVTGEDRSPYVFRTAMQNGQQDRPLGWYVATEMGLMRAATMAWDFLVGEERAGSFAATFTEAGGTIVTEQKPPLGTTDYGPFISEINPDEVDVAYAFFAGPGAISYVQQMRQFGLTPDLQLVASGYFTAGVLEQMGADALGLVQGVQYTPVLDNPENQTFLDLFDTEVGGEPGVYQEEGYLGAMVAAGAINAVGGDLSDTQAFLDAVATLELDTPSGPFRFDESGQSVRNTYITRVVETDDGGVTHEVVETIEDVSQDWMPQ